MSVSERKKQRRWLRMETDVLFRHYANITKRIKRDVEDLSDRLRDAVSDIKAGEDVIGAVTERTIYSLDTIMKDLRLLRDMIERDTEGLVKG